MILKQSKIPDYRRIALATLTQRRSSQRIVTDKLLVTLRAPKHGGTGFPQFRNPHIPQNRIRHYAPVSSAGGAKSACCCCAASVPLIP